MSKSSRRLKRHHAPALPSPGSFVSTRSGDEKKPRKFLGLTISREPTSRTLDVYHRSGEILTELGTSCSLPPIARFPISPEFHHVKFIVIESIKNPHIYMREKKEVFFERSSSRSRPRGRLE